MSMPAICESARPSPDVATASERRSLLSERHLHCMWYDQLFHREKLVTEDGRSVEVLFPGIWNKTGSGPDFSHAALRIGGTKVNGDIEVHVWAGDWDRHNHATDTAYSNVVLHVALCDDTAGRAQKNARGERLPLLVLSRFMDRSAEEVLASLELSEYPHARPAGVGKCWRFIAGSTTARERMTELIRVAGKWRLEQKAFRFGLWLASDGYEEALYRGIMETLGYRANRIFFSHLARRMPLAEVRATVLLSRGAPRELVAEALLMRGAGFLEERPGRTTAWGREGRILPDEETVGYLATLRQLSHGVAAENLFVERAAIRPAHAPERRVAGVARLFFGVGGDTLPQDILRLLSDKGCTDACSKLARRLTVEGSGYWGLRSRFGPPVFPHPMRLLGAGWARIAVANVLVPLAIACARAKGDAQLETATLNSWAASPGLPENAAIRLARYRMFGVVPTSVSTRTVHANDVTTHFGLVQMYDDFCSRGQEGCEACPAPQVLAQCR